jgi:hypothetical protein
MAHYNAVLLPEFYDMMRERIDRYDEELEAERVLWQKLDQPLDKQLKREGVFVVSLMSVCLISHPAETLCTMCFRLDARSRSLGRARGFASYAYLPNTA